MTIRTCVEKTKEHSPEVEEKHISKAYFGFFASSVLIYATVLVWAIMVVASISDKLMIALELALTGIFVYLLSLGLRASTETKESFQKLRKFSKTLWLWVFLLVASLVAIVFLRINLFL